MTCVVDGDETLLGIITDGDLRRHMERGADIRSLTAGRRHDARPVSIPPATLAAEALNIMEQRKITSIVVVDARGASSASCTCTTCGERRYNKGVLILS